MLGLLSAEMRNYSRGELQDRWVRLVEAETTTTDPSEQEIVRRQKEEWFSDSFKFLIQLADGVHIWCGYSALMGPLLEAFHGYYQDDLPASPLKLLWKRISQELRACTHCISQHHEAKQAYSVEFESDTVGPLLNVLETLDEERVTEHLKVLNKKNMAGKQSLPDYNDEVISVLFEVLMFPQLLDDQSLVNEFIPFIEAVDDSQELTLAGHQQYPGVYALLFMKSEKVRSIGLRLAGGMGKLRKAADIEPLQPLLKKCISMLEFEISRSTLNTSRPRMQLERITVWLGIKALLVFLEPQAFEEGILERYPIFLSIVLNHISDDTVEFSHAVTCLRLLFEMLGCKAWLKTTFSPSVMRNTFLGQCFHTRNEKSHKEIFDLFMPFLKSLEPLQDGEHEKQRRHLLYFLLHQVPRSSNFSLLMQKKACKIALLIVDRGYKMKPPCPPLECSHMWGPSLLCSLKDSALHSSLRQPAFDLFNTIIVSDTAALACWKLKLHSYTEINVSRAFNDDEDDDPFSGDAEEKETTCWTEFNTLSKLTVRECNEWMCIPLIWFNVLVEMNLSSLPISFAKAVIWALSRFSIMEAGSTDNMTVSVKDWILLYAGSISHSFEWEIPKGCDDGGDGRPSKNSVQVSASCDILISTLKRCAAQFILQLKQGELQKQWAWEPTMAESLVLLLMDPNDNARQVSRIILEHFSQSRSLVGGLQFLCSSAASMSSMFLGLRYAFKMMTSVRLMEALPVIFEKLRNSELFCFAASKLVFPGPFDFKWLRDLIDWGKSSLLVIKKHWKQCLFLLLNLFKKFSLAYSAQVIGKIEELVSCDADTDAISEIQVQISRLSVSLCTDAVHTVEKRSSEPDYSSRQNSLLEVSNKFVAEASRLAPADAHVSDAVTKPEEPKEVVILSDDEADKATSSAELDGASDIQSGKLILDQEDFSKDILAEDNLLSASKKVLSTTLVPKVKGISEVLPEAGNSCIDSKTASRKHITSRRDSPDNFDTNNLDSMRSSAQVKPVNNTTIIKTLQNDSVECGRISLDEKDEAVIQKLVHTEGESTGSTGNCERRQSSMLSKFSMVIPKRQLIQLGVPSGSKISNLHKQECPLRRFRPVRLDDWYKPILEVDYFSIVGLTAENNDGNGIVLNLAEVPTYFDSPQHYVEIFRPLVLEEFKAQLRNSYVESFSSDEVCSGSLRIISVERIDDFHVIRCLPDASESFTSRTFYENDLVLLTKEPFQSAFQAFHAVGKVDRREKDNKSRSNVLVIRFYFSGGSARLAKARRLLTERSKWCVTRIMSITSQVREFQALSSLNDIPILSVILNPYDSKANDAGSRNINLGRLPEAIQQKLKSSFNDGQLQAISTAIERSGASGTSGLQLIQGPPGTGKTKTIVGIVSALLALDATQKIDQQKAQGSNGVWESNSKRLSNQSVAIARAWQDAALARQVAKEGDNMATVSVGSFKRKRVLICAQSNAAVDELVSRISRDGLYGSDGLIYKPYLVRTGNVKTVHPNSMSFFIDTLVEQRLAEQRINEGDISNDVNLGSTVLRSELEKLMERIQSFEAKRAKFRDNSELETRTKLGEMAAEDDDLEDMSEAATEVTLQRLNAKKKAIYRDLSIAQARERKTFEESRSQKLRLRKCIIREAEILVTTLSGCGGDIYAVCSESISSNRFGRPSEEFLFDVVVIDEAAQALEPATLIPLQLLKSSGTKCIMVGDPKQLPATVLSNIASKFLFECSMFERLQRAGYPVTMLTTQYRMHPEICQFPSLHFYEGRLLNGHDATKKSAPFHKSMFFGPYVFFDVTDGHERRGTGLGGLSISNKAEADVVIEVLRFLKKRYPSEFLPKRIGIISPYKSQVTLLRARFADAFGSVTSADVEFNTVDGFQGREIDILILSTVRACEPDREEPAVNSSVIGFVADVRRMNVALTRARLSLWVLGNAKTLQTNLHWASLLSNAKERNLVISVHRPYESIFRSSSISRHTVTSKGKECAEKSFRDHMHISYDEHAEINNTEKGLKEKRSFRSILKDVDDLDLCQSYRHGKPSSHDSEWNTTKPAENRPFFPAEKSKGHMIKGASHGSSKHGRSSHGSECDMSRPTERFSRSSMAERSRDLRTINRQNETCKGTKEMALSMEYYRMSKTSTDCADASHEIDANSYSLLVADKASCTPQMQINPSVSSSASNLLNAVDTKSSWYNLCGDVDRIDTCHETEHVNKMSPLLEIVEGNHPSHQRTRPPSAGCISGTKGRHHCDGKDKYLGTTPSQDGLEVETSKSAKISGAGGIKGSRFSVSPSADSVSCSVNKSKERNGSRSRKVTTDQENRYGGNSSTAGTLTTSSLANSGNSFGQVSPITQDRPGDGGKNDGSHIARNSANDPLIARKRQRDAVEALLPSALISSKKPEISMAMDRLKMPSPSSSRVASGTRCPPQDIGPSSSQSQQKPVDATHIRVPPPNKKSGSIDIQEEWEAYKNLVQEQRRK
ncbi:uncharacterized protein LOC116267851 isoform X2 [Nymphaea colorata]|uniref:uncharacterized protein LOC116267851 isoform X2 n=1 Tax=Nymphaea colorata TaxID=210225 RepID=UPI00129EE209|nr:uncharacterized protein LOC116267851 isoform X2 [Nymphaea colorata]